MTILMLCNKIEINESERLTETFKKNTQTMVLHRFSQNFKISYNSCRKVKFKEN